MISFGYSRPERPVLYSPNGPRGKNFRAVSPAGRERRNTTTTAFGDESL